MSSWENPFQIDWKITNFRTGRQTPQLSAQFPPRKLYKQQPYETVKFELKLLDSQSNSIVQLYPSSFPVTHKRLNVYYFISLLDAQGGKCFIKEGRAVFNKCQNDVVEYNILENYFKTADLLPNGTLTVHCEVIVSIDIIDQCDNSSQERFSSNGKLSEDLYQLLHSGNLSDVVLVVDGREFKAHKTILSARSALFARMFQEDCSLNRVDIDMPELDITVMEELLRYIYTEHISSLDLYALAFFAAACKYEMEDLKSTCELHLSGSLTNETVIDTLLLADDHHGATKLREECLQYIKKNMSTIQQTDRWNEAVILRPELFCHF